MAGYSGNDVILLFCPDAVTLHDTFAKARASLTKSGGLWVCRPKRGSKADRPDGERRP